MPHGQGARKLVARLPVAVFGIYALSVAAVAQKSGEKPIEMPPTTPVMSPAELAGKVPAPRPDDVKSLDAIISAAYAVISGPAGTRDWDRFRSIFLPQARFTEVGKAPDGSTIIISWNVDEFIRERRYGFRQGCLLRKRHCQ